MADVQELLKQARALGEAIASHPDVQAYLAARNKVDSDAEAQQILKSYTQHSARVRTLEAQQKPIEPDDKRKLVEYEQQLASNAALKELMRRQVDYVTLMNQVNQAMENPLAARRTSGESS
jgi:cell fate (sporulation/competence/biofilm development) regulator YlbF (YheA/YmcA/DUF963 family)